MSGHHTKAYKTCVEKMLIWGKDSCVMLCKYVDVIDGLVNGVYGTQFTTMRIIHFHNKRNLMMIKLVHK